MNEFDHLLVSDFKSLAEEQQNSICRYLSTKFNKPVKIFISHWDYYWVDVVGENVKIRPTAYCNCKLLSKHNLIETATFGMLL